MDSAALKAQFKKEFTPEQHKEFLNRASIIENTAYNLKHIDGIDATITENNLIFDIAQFELLNLRNTVWFRLDEGFRNNYLNLYEKYKEKVEDIKSQMIQNDIVIETKFNLEER